MIVGQSRVDIEGEIVGPFADNTGGRFVVAEDELTS
jgi:hypothetical protein